MNPAAFTEALGDIFEHTPAIAQAVYNQRPFGSREDLLQAMIAVMRSRPEADKLALILAHPDLGSRAKMAEASIQEQASLGLDQLSAAEFERFQELNRAYKTKFGFPFIVAVKYHTKVSILSAFEQRLQQDLPTEKNRALAEIEKIAALRLRAIVVDSSRDISHDNSHDNAAR